MFWKWISLFCLCISWSMTVNLSIYTSTHLSFSWWTSRFTNSCSFDKHTFIGCRNTHVSKEDSERLLLNLKLNSCFLHASRVIKKTHNKRRARGIDDANYAYFTAVKQALYNSKEPNCNKNYERATNCKQIVRLFPKDTFIASRSCFIVFCIVNTTVICNLFCS